MDNNKNNIININKEIPERFYDYVFDWNHEIYVLCGGYGSSKSYSTVCKIIFELLQTKRTVLVVRQYFSTIYESCFSLFYEVLDEMNLLTPNYGLKVARTKVVYSKSPMSFKFPNGSRIIFKGLDDPQKVKSINNISIVWIEEATEIKYAAYKEMLGRIRTPNVSLHFILTFNPVDKNNWVYQHFFIRTDENGQENIILNDEELYERKTIIKNKVYYHYSNCEDNPYLPESYIERLDEMSQYDKELYVVARLGHFGAVGTRVLPQFEVAETNREVFNAVSKLPQNAIHTGMDFGFEESFNAVINCAVDTQNRILYIFREYYKNHMTDMDTVNDEDFKKFKKYYIIADSEDPKAIAFYRQMGYRMRGAKKFPGSRLSYTRKIKRFSKIICAPQCINTIRELKYLTYAQDKDGNTIPDEFNIDPHTLSAIWYALDIVEVVDLKHNYTSKKGSIF